MSEPSDQNGASAGLKPIAAATPDALVVGMLRALSEPALLLTAGGSILAANGAAAELFGIAPTTLGGARLKDYVTDEPANGAHYLAACARTRSPLPGTLCPRSPAADNAPAERQRVRVRSRNPRGQARRRSFSCASA